MRTLIIDNYDSFTYNLYQEVARINQIEPIVIKNDSLSLAEILRLSFDNIIISPGPGHPAKIKDFGIGTELILNCDVPILGICLGHQGIVSSFGGTVVQAPKPMHGQTTKIYHQNDALFSKIPQSFSVVRYHSLIAIEPLPEQLQAIAFTEDQLIMALKHRTRPIWGVQYHPESICSEYGQQLLTNFKILSEQYLAKKQKSFELKIKKIMAPTSPAAYFSQYLREKQHAVWLDSSRLINNYSRFSIMGCLDGPLSHQVYYDMLSQTVYEHQFGKCQTYSISIFDYLKKQISQYHVTPQDLPFDFYGGYIGYFAYELYQETLNIPARYSSPHPEAQFLFLDRVIIFDHEQECYYLLALTKPEHLEDSENWMKRITDELYETKKISSLNRTKQYKIEFSQSKTTYLDKIKDCLKYIQEGESYEICLTNRLKCFYPVPGLDLYLKLRNINPAPYGCYLRFGDLEISCASIERFIKIDSQGWIETKPIKGTLPRGKTEADDLKSIFKLKNDVKFRSENLMIVDLLRNDLGKICEIGSVQVTKLMDVESYQTVHQLVSTISGKIKSKYDVIDCIKALFPGGSMTGAPKKRTIEIIETLEDESRNIYSGSLGYLSINGCADLNIVIRTAVITPKETVIGVGGAIIALSEPEEEFEEILLKSQSIQEALKNISQDD
jgi:para-aminobenzoate synthetase